MSHTHTHTKDHTRDQSEIRKIRENSKRKGRDDRMRGRLPRIVLSNCGFSSLNCDPFIGDFCLF